MVFGAHKKLVGRRETCRFVVYSACIDAIVAGKISHSLIKRSAQLLNSFFFSCLLVVTLADTMCRRFGRGLVFSSANRLHLF